MASCLSRSTFVVNIRIFEWPLVGHSDRRYRPARIDGGVRIRCSKHFKTEINQTTADQGGTGGGKNESIREQ